MLAGAGSRFNTMDRRLPFGRNGVSRSFLIAASTDGGASRPIHQPWARAAPFGPRPGSVPVPSGLFTVGHDPDAWPNWRAGYEPAESTYASTKLDVMMA